jgi:hypothetical protein
LASGVSLLAFQVALAELRQSYGFNCNGLDSESSNSVHGGDYFGNLDYRIVKNVE